MKEGDQDRKHPPKGESHVSEEAARVRGRGGRGKKDRSIRSMKKRIFKTSKKDGKKRQKTMIKDKESITDTRKEDVKKREETGRRKGRAGGEKDVDQQEDERRR